MDDYEATLALKTASIRSRNSDAFPISTPKLGANNSSQQNNKNNKITNNNDDDREGGRKSGHSSRSNSLSKDKIKNSTMSLKKGQHIKQTGSEIRFDPKANKYYVTESSVDDPYNIHGTLKPLEFKVGFGSLFDSFQSNKPKSTMSLKHKKRCVFGVFSMSVCVFVFVWGVCVCVCEFV